MYKSCLTLSFAITAFSLLQSCSKDDTIKAPDYGDKLNTVEWNAGAQKETYEYNSDNTLKRIVYTSGQASDSYEFTWNGNKLAEMFEKNATYKNFYYYDNAGKVSHTTTAIHDDASKTTNKMEYTYRSDGKVDQLKYFVINYAGTELRAITTYHYNTAGDLDHSVTTTGNYTITQQIEGYSQPVKFNPWGFIDLTLLENYMIYNYPVLSTMKGFPAKVTRKVKIGNDPEFVDIVTTNTSEISNKRINKMTIELTSPSTPSINKIRTGTFNYK
jgi:hypothetical protein